MNYVYRMVCLCSLWSLIHFKVTLTYTLRSITPHQVLSLSYTGLYCGTHSPVPMSTDNTALIPFLSRAGKQHETIIWGVQFRAQRRVTYDRSLSPHEGGETGTSVPSSQSESLVTVKITGTTHCLSVTVNGPISRSIKRREAAQS